MSLSEARNNNICKSLKLTLLLIVIVVFMFCYLLVIFMCFFILDGQSMLQNRSLKTIDVLNESPRKDQVFSTKTTAQSKLKSVEYFQGMNFKNYSYLFKRQKRVYTRANDGLFRKLPEVLIIGVKKGGTRALLEFLRIHPDIRATGKETHFFDKHFQRGFEWYRNKMPLTVKGQITMEKTPKYFVTESVPARVFSMSSDVRLLVIVRDPVTRAISDYAQIISKSSNPGLPFSHFALKNSTGKINRSWHALRVGMYSKHFDRWLNFFPKENFHFVNGERLLKSPAKELTKVEDFLNLSNVITSDHFFYNHTKGFPCLKKWRKSNRPRCLGKTKGRKHPPISDHIIKKLRRFYRPYNQKFYKMTNINFNWG